MRERASKWDFTRKLIKIFFIFSLARLFYSSFSKERDKIHKSCIIILSMREVYNSTFTFLRFSAWYVQEKWHFHANNAIEFRNKINICIMWLSSCKSSRSHFRSGRFYFPKIKELGQWCLKLSPRIVDHATQQRSDKAKTTKVQAAYWLVLLPDPWEHEWRQMAKDSAEKFIRRNFRESLEREIHARARVDSHSSGPRPEAIYCLSLCIKVQCARKTIPRNFIASCGKRYPRNKRT